MKAKITICILGIGLTAQSTIWACDIARLSTENCAVTDSLTHKVTISNPTYDGKPFLAKACDETLFFTSEHERAENLCQFLGFGDDAIYSVEYARGDQNTQAFLIADSEGKIISEVHWVWDRSTKEDYLPKFHTQVFSQVTCFPKNQ